MSSPKEHPRASHLDHQARDQFYRLLFESIHEGFCVLWAVPDDQGRIADLVFREVNRAFEQHAGQKDTVGRTVGELLPQYERYWMDLCDKVLATGEAVRAENYVPDVRRWYDVFFSRIGGEGSRFVAVVFADITDRRRAEDRQTFLLKLADGLRPLADATAIQREASRIVREHLGADCVVYWELSGDEVFAAAEDAPYGTPSFLGQRHRLSDYGLVKDGHAPGKLSVRDDVSTSPEFFPAQKAAIAALNVNAWAAAPLGKDGELRSFLVAYFRDAHAWTQDEVALLHETAERTWAALERARTEAALRESEQRARTLLAEATAARSLAESANFAKDEFLATLSHELRTPLAAILLWAGALRSGAVPIGEVARAIEAIGQSAESQSRLIEDLLDLSRLTSGKLVLTHSAVDVAGVASVAVDMMRPLAAAKKLTLEAHIEDGLGFAVLDGTRLKQILGNLLTNATKFTHEGGSVTLRVARKEAWLELEVADTGEGIAPEFMPHLFERFRQADMGETRQHMGLGIGLALTRQLVELHGGRIEAESDGLGRGARFRVRLPWVEPERAGVVQEETTETAAWSTSPLSGVRVLLVEDDENTREAMRWTLARAGARVVTVEDADRAIAVQLGEEPVEVIVSDLGLPTTTGYTLIQRIAAECRARGRTPPPSCAVSAHARDVDRARAIEAGFDMYLAKPITPERLVEAVADLREIGAVQR